MILSLHPTEATATLTQPLAIVMPIYNEAANIEAVIAEWIKALESEGVGFQFVLVNDGSKDDTLASLRRIEAQRPEQIVVIDKPNSGHGRSCRLGYDTATGSASVEWILQIDSDGQCDPAYFKEFWAKANAADCVFGIRTQRDDGVARMLTSKICKMGATLLGRTDMVDPNVPYRLIRKSVLATALKRVPPAFNIHNVALTYILKKTPGVRWEYVPIHFRDRQGGSNSINLPQVVHLGIDMLLELSRLK